MGDFVLLLIALLLWSVSLFLVGEAGKSHRWALGGPDGMPEPYSGVALAQLLSCLFILLWLGRTFVSNRGPQDPLAFFSQLIARPELLTPGIALAALPPLTVGVVKLATALVVDRGDEEPRIRKRNRLRVSSVLIALHAIVALGALALIRRFLG